MKIFTFYEFTLREKTHERYPAASSSARNSTSRSFRPTAITKCALASFETIILLREHPICALPRYRAFYVSGLTFSYINCRQLVMLASTVASDFVADDDAPALVTDKVLSPRGKYQATDRNTITSDCDSPRISCTFTLYATRSANVIHVETCRAYVPSPVAFLRFTGKSVRLLSACEKHLRSATETRERSKNRNCFGLAKSALN